jgi:hypothetical protein
MSSSLADGNNTVWKTRFFQPFWIALFQPLIEPDVHFHGGLSSAKGAEL